MTDAVYQSLPASLQNGVCWLYGVKERKLRYGNSFHERLASLLETEWWSADAIAYYKNEQVARLIRHAYTNVPYYHEVMRNARLQPDDVRTVADLSKLPVLTKETVRANAQRLRARGVNTRSLHRKYTSGTTGTSLAVLLPGETIAFQWALAWRHRQRFGIRWGDLHANFTG
jgi:phenylacetate-CoA ligase